MAVTPAISLSSLGEKLPQHRRTGLFPKPPIDLWRMVAGALGENPGTMVNATAFGIKRPKIKPPETSERESLSAHGAGFQGDIKITSEQTGCAEALAAGPENKHLCMSGRIVKLFNPVPRSGNNLTGNTLDKDGTHRNLAGGSGFRRLFQRCLHIIFCLFGHAEDSGRWPGQPSSRRLHVAPGLGGL